MFLCYISIIRIADTSQVSYDAVGNVSDRTDALGATLFTTTYDALNRPVGVTGLLGHTVAFEYDALSRLTRTTDPLGRITEFSYDALNRMSGCQDALNDQSTQTFDSDGNLTGSTDPITTAPASRSIKTDVCISTWTQVSRYFTHRSRQVCNLPFNAAGLQTWRERCWETNGQVLNHSIPKIQKHKKYRHPS